MILPRQKRRKIGGRAHERAGCCQRSEPASSGERGLAGHETVERMIGAPEGERKGDLRCDDWMIRPGHEMVVQ